MANWAEGRVRGVRGVGGGGGDFSRKAAGDHSKEDFSGCFIAHLVLAFIRGCCEVLVERAVCRLRRFFPLLWHPAWPGKGQFTRLCTPVSTTSPLCPVATLLFLHLHGRRCSIISMFLTFSPGPQPYGVTDSCPSRRNGEVDVCVLLHSRREPFPDVGRLSVFVFETSLSLSLSLFVC